MYDAFHCMWMEYCLGSSVYCVELPMLIHTLRERGHQATMVILVAAALFGNLWHWEMTIAPEDLEALYLFPSSEAMYPAHVSCPAGECDCLAGFRGSTSLLLPKSPGIWSFSTTT